MYDLGKDGLLLFLIHPGGPFFSNKDEGFWSIPKGLVEAGEDLLQAAIREFNEETGIVPAGPYLELGAIRQKGGKEVHAWAFRGQGKIQPEWKSNTFTLEWPPKSGKKMEFPEADKAQYFTVQEARIKINAAQSAFIDRLVDQIDSFRQ